MTLKKIITCSICLCITFAAMAQDKIFKKNGEIIDAKISLINGDIIVFKRFDNPDGPEYSIPKADVTRIKYVNGSQDIFEENNDRIGVVKGKENAHMYNEFARNKNIIAFAPLLFTEHGIGIAVNWEHSLDKAGWVTVNIPAMITWSNANGADQQRDVLAYLMPGIKVYPTLNTSLKNKFSIGPSLVFAMGQGSPNNNTYSDPIAHQNHLMMGALAVIGANMFPTTHTYLGLDFGMGYSYINKYNNVDNSTAFMVEFSLKCGYRYESKLKRKSVK